MTRLTIFTEDGQPQRWTDDAAEITAELAAIGVEFERWPAADHDALMDRLRPQGYTTTDTVAVSPDHPDRDAMRAKFLSEHRHKEEEVRFFTAGQGLFSLRHEGRVFAVQCMADDLIFVPAGMRHWFDMGSHPNFTAIRFFRTAEGWVGDFTGDPIADRFPRLETA